MVRGQQVARRESFGGPPDQRRLKVGELVRRNLAGVIERLEFDDPVLQNISITVTEVRMSPDFRNATVFVLPLGGKNSSEVANSLNKEQRRVRHLLNRGLKLKYSPRLVFVSDDRFDRFDRIARLIAEDRRKRLDSSADNK